MNQLNFWRSWHPQSRFFYVFLLILLVIVLVWYGVSFFQNPAPAIQWELASNIDTVPVKADQFKVGLFDFSYTVDNYLVSEVYRGSPIQINTAIVYAFLFLIAISLVVLAVIISTLQRFWYYFGVLVLIGILVGFKLEQLLLFGETGKIGLIIALSLYLPATYYFKTMRSEAGLLPRLLVFAGITLTLALVVLVFAEADHPAMVLVSYGSTVPVVLSVFFIFLLGHVVISFFLMLVTRSNTFGSKNSIIHFSAISVIYLANIFLLYLKNAGFIDWDLLYLNAFFILPVAAFIGIWEFRLRELQYQSVFHFNPLGGYFYITLAIITFATCSYFFATANDPVLEALEDSIVFSQMGYGLLFFLYVIANFIGPLMENKQVFRVMYKPASFPYATAQVVGTIAVAAFFLRAGMFPFYQAVSGYYNGIGDLNWYNGDRFVAEQFYKLGDQYGFNNHRSNYSLGTLASMQNDEVLAPYYFSEALAKNPTPHATVNLSNALGESEQFFDALFTLRRGLNHFPDNPYLQNNLALIYGKTSVIDSALIYLEEAKKEPETRRAAEANTLSVIARFAGQLDFSVDTLLQETVSDEEYVQNRINALLLLNQHPEDSSGRLHFNWHMPEDSVLGSFRFAYLYNYLLHQKSEVDTATLRQVALLKEMPENGNFYEPLSLGLAMAYYETNQVIRAFKILDELQSLNPFKTGYYNNVLGLWALQQQTPDIAVRHFTKAAQHAYEDAEFRRAVSLTEAASKDPKVNWKPVRQLWETLTSDTVEVSAGVKLVAEDMKKVLSADSLLYYVQEADDAFRYQVLRYRWKDLNANMLDQVFASFSDPNYKTLAIHDLLITDPDLERKWPETQVESLLSVRDVLTPLGKHYLDWIQVLQMQKDGRYQDMKGKINQLPALSLWHRYKKNFFKARLAEVQQDSASARRHYQYLISNPFYEEGFLSAMAFLYPEKNSLQAYELLLDAIQTNPRSPMLLKAYIRVSLANGLETYAEEAMQDLQALVLPEEYESFLEVYRQLKAENTIDF